jgi:hypothetical protein
MPEPVQRLRFACDVPDCDAAITVRVIRPEGVTFTHDDQGAHTLTLDAGSLLLNATYTED